ncbi:MAG TPA: thiamine-phosphate kinase [Methylomirabilota bacterium]|nr:thiamine-phosphate kinase [Methylomirabilota bacterium]
MKEVELIARLTQGLPQHDGVVTGPGDDCAVVDLGVPDKLFLLKTDAVVEGSHFHAESEPERIGRKAIARCCSDIAAMGGTPLHALVTLGLPPHFDVAVLDRVYAGMRAITDEFKISIVGGETTRNPERMFISIAMLGSVGRERCIRRSRAQAGDAIFVTGELGGSIEGKHFDFVPRLKEGQWLAENLPLTAMIDVSDGLASDLRHILNQSNVGAELFEQSLPVSRVAKLRAREHSNAKPPTLAALTDGEDFELLFTLPSKSAVAALDGFKAAFPDVRLTCIGKITKDPGLRLRDARGVKELNFHGYDHFA